jgi:hypothetical protein
MSIGRNIPPIGGQANVWSAATTGAATTSPSVNTYNSPFVSAFGNVSGATTITLMLSADNVNFYAGPTVVLSGAGNFYIDATVGAQYVALQSSNSVTATATIQAKG